MVGDDGGFGAVALHGDDDVAAVSAHAHLGARCLTAEPASIRELELDVLQLNVIHTVGKNKTVDRLNSPNHILYFLNLLYCMLNLV